MAESSWLDAFERQGHPVTILRLPHVVGRGCELGPVPLHNRDRSALRRLRENKELWLIGGGDQRIQIVDAHDVATVILGVPGSSKAAGQVYNCANPDVLTAREYWQLVADFVGVTLRVRPVPEVDLTGCGWGWALTALPRVVDMESLAQDVGVVPCTPVASSLHACVRWLDEHPAGWGRDVISELSDREPPRTRAEWHDALRTAAVHRGRSDVDARMNLGWNASVAPGLAAERKRCK
jgi:nucleoside-diphosphate-sugar epimerase